MALDTNFNTQITQAVTSLVSADKLEFANLIYSATSQVGDFAAKHKIITDVRNGNLVPIISQGNNYGALSASATDCSMNECDLTDTYSNKKWVVGEYDCRFSICLKSYSEDFKLFWGMYNQTVENPLTEPDKNAFFAYVTDKAQKNVQGALWRTGYHGDEASANALISENNGYWTNADAGDGLKLVIPAGDLTGEQIYAQFEAVYDEAIDQDWFVESKMKFVVTRKVARTLVKFLNSSSDRSAYNCDCIDPSKITGSRAFGVDNLSVFGIPVVSHQEEQEAGKAVGVQPDYKILLINEDNMLVGVNTTEHLDQFEIIYDAVSKKVLVDMAVQIGTSIPLDEYVFAAQATV